MFLEELIKDANPIEICGDTKKDIKGIKYDSRNVTAGDLFVCVTGFKTDGHLYVHSAVKNGAIAILAEKDLEVPQNVTLIKVADTRVAMADLAARFYGNPSSKLKLIGVTGTNGKTTTTHLIKKILEEAGYTVGLLGTISNMIGNEVLPAERTTPEAPDLQFLLHKMVNKGAHYAVMEVSSHALQLYRVRGCKFRSAVFTNISQDHLDFHESMEEYVDEKKKLFAMLSSSSENYGLVNNDDLYHQHFEEASKVPVFKYAVDGSGDFKAQEVDVKPQGVSYTAFYPGGKISLNLKLTGLFSVYNSLAAFAVGFKEGIAPEIIKKALENITGVPGRFEKIECNQDFTVIVDYAHTPDSLKNVLETAKDFAKRRIITVFGCGGDRDRTKRPLMGEAAALNSDICVVTSDNPRSEDPEAIIEDIIPGVKKHTNSFKIEVDRKKAIKLALEMAQKNDIVIIAGKGHETYQEINGKKLPFDDKEVVKSILSER